MLGMGRIVGFDETRYRIIQKTGLKSVFYIRLLRSRFLRLKPVLVYTWVFSFKKLDIQFFKNRAPSPVGAAPIAHRMHVTALFVLLSPNRTGLTNAVLRCGSAGQGKNKGFLIQYY